MAWDDAPPTALELKSSPQALPWDAAPPTKEELAVNATNAPGKPQTFLEHAGNALTFGYLPQLQAGVAKVLPNPNAEGDEKLREQGFNLPDSSTSYVKERDSNIKRLNAEGQANPKTALAGTVAGALTGAAVTPIPGGASKGLLGLVGKGAAYGGAVGALGNPGDTEGKIDPIQAKERAVNAGKGMLVGGASGLATGLVSKGLNAAANSAKNAESFAATKAFKGSGAMLKDFRAAAAKGEIENTGKFMLDNGLIKAGDTFDDVAEKTAQFNKQAGEKLDQIYNQATAAAGTKAAEGMSAGFNPVADKAAILKAAEAKLGDSVGAKGAAQKLSGYLDDLGEKYGDQPLDPRKANDIKGHLDDEVNYARNPLNKQPDAEKAFSAARKVVAQKIEDHIDLLGKISGNPDAAQALKSANKDYGISAQVGRIAKDRMNRESANRPMSLTDTIAGGAGGVVGGAMGQAMGGDMKHAGTGALLGGLVSAGANHFGRTYGTGLMAGGANSLAAPVLRYTAQPVGQAGQAIMQNPGLISRGLINAGMINNELKPGQPQPQVPPGLIMQAQQKKKDSDRKPNSR